MSFPLIEAECALCAVLRAAPGRPFDLVWRGRPSVEEILYVGSRTVLVLDVAPVVTGHCLIVTQEHVPAFAGAQDEWDEALDIRAALDAACLSGGSGAGVSFEHGECDASRRPGGCAIRHAHLHYAPVALVLDSSQLSGLAWEPMDAPDMLHRYQGQEYLLVMDSLGARVARSKDGEGQTLRRALAQCVGQPESWNWHDQVVLPDAMQVRHRQAEGFARLARIAKGLGSMRSQR